MNKLRVIDLLNKIANGEEIPLIKYRDKILHWNKKKDRFEDKDGMSTLYEMDFSELNDEIEIIEEDKKIEKLKWNEKSSYNQEGDTKKVQKILLSRSEQLKSSINEIIDYLEEKE